MKGAVMGGSFQVVVELSRQAAFLPSFIAGSGGDAYCVAADLAEPDSPGKIAAAYRSDSRTRDSGAACRLPRFLTCPRQA
jgi:hypothetical protein